MTKRQILCVLLAIVLMMAQRNLILGQMDSSYTSTARVEQSSLAELGSNPLIASYDLSPDGKTVALLVVASSKVGAPLWLLAEDIASGRIISKLDLGASTFPGGGFALQVLYASNQRYLVVQDLQQIRVFDANSLKLVRTIAGPPTQPPLFVLAATKSNILVCAFGSPVPPEFGVHVTPAQLEVVDIISGKLLSEWASDDVPQAVSANGELIAISSSKVQKGLLPLNVFDNKGNRMAELDGSFSFRKVGDPSKPLGRVMGLFVGGEEILLSPDGNVDQTGHHSGDKLEIVNVISKQILQKVNPQNYGSTGEMAISGDHKTMLIVSWYLPAGIVRNEEKAIPASSSPEALVFVRGASLFMDATLPIPKSGLNLSGWQEARRPRLSSDGSVIAIAQDGGVTVLTKNPASRPQ
jgi:hypothetical protein